MQTITIEAASAESAPDLYVVLARFGADLRDTDDGRRFIDVDVSGDCDIVEVLNAIEHYVTHRNDGAARVAFDGRSYTLQAAP